MNKKELRLSYSKRRENLSEEQVSDLSLEISNQLLKLPIWNFEYFHLFLSISEKKEIDTSYILTILQGKDKNIILPKMNTDGSLTNFLLTDSTVIKKNSYNVPEPIKGIQINPLQIEVVFVPLLAYDTLGNRVGYGKGFYDQFLASCKADVITIGVSFFEPEEKITDVIATDIPLDYCVTPQQIFQF